MDDLADRVLAAIEAKEAKARAATPGPWTAGKHDGPGEGIVYGADWRIAEATLYPRSRAHSRFPKLRVPVHLIDANANAAHIVDSDPVEVLRRCAADRRIVDMYLTELRVEQEDNPHRIGAARMWGGGKLSAARIAVVLLADGYGLVKADDVFSQMAVGTEEQPETDGAGNSSEEDQ